VANLVPPTNPSRTDALARYDALLRISQQLAHHRSISELVNVLADHLHAVVPFDYLALVLHEAATEQMRLLVLAPPDIPRPPAETMPVDAGGPAARVWQSQQATVIPIPPTGTLVTALDFIRSFGQKITCWLPLTTAQARVGVLTFGSSRETEYGTDAIAFMEQVAAHVAVAVDNAINFDRARQLTGELRVERDRLQLLLEVGNLLVSHLDYAELLKAISESLRRVVRHDYVSVAVYDERAGGLRVPLTFDESRGIGRPEIVWPIEGSPAGLVYQRRVMQLFDRRAIDAFPREGTATLPTTDLQKLCCLPLVARHSIVGTLNVSSADPEAFSNGDLDLLARLALQIAIAVENAIAYRAIEDRRDHLLEEKEYLENEIRLQSEFDEIVGRSSTMRRLLQTVKTVAPTDATVLVLGETGTGKELIARAIHRLSARNARTFVRLSAAALPTTLLESELFGYDKGAFTGASAGKIGRLELADGGTLFLDEVGDLPLEVQPKLLRVLQEREFERLGSTRTRHADVRIVAATSRELDRMVEEGTFRSDLYYRLNVFPIKVPPLRDRKDDIPALAKYFTERLAKRMRRPVPQISERAMRALQEWNWPGNIRELENIIERAVILTTGATLQVPEQDLRSPDRPLPMANTATLRDMERDTIVRALRESRGVVGGPSGAAARLGLKRTTLQSMMQKLGIRRPMY
jgi:formate hydrogenlyase transcriptional activator